MGMPPTGEIVARPMVRRACGCLQEFQYYAVDKYRAQRQAKFQKTRCPACVAKLVEEQRRMSMVPKKGEAFKLLPTETQVTLTRRKDGTWAGTLTADGTTVEATGEGPQGLTIGLARLWLAAHTAGTETASPAVTPPPAAPATKPAAKPSAAKPGTTGKPANA